MVRPIPSVHSSFQRSPLHRFGSRGVQPAVTSPFPVCVRFGDRSPSRLMAAFVVLHYLGGLLLPDPARVLHRTSSHGVRAVSALQERFPTTRFCPSKLSSLNAASDCSSTSVTRVSCLTRYTEDLALSFLLGRRFHNFRCFHSARTEPQGFAPHPEPFSTPPLPTTPSQCSLGLAWVIPAHPHGRQPDAAEATAGPFRLGTAAPLARHVGLHLQVGCSR